MEHLISYDERVQTEAMRAASSKDALQGRTGYSIAVGDADFDAKPVRAMCLLVCPASRASGSPQSWSFVYRLGLFGRVG